MFVERLLKEPIYTRHWDQMIGSPPSYLNVSTQQNLYLKGYQTILNDSQRLAKMYYFDGKWNDYQKD